jgi:hypothetical protein
MDAHHNNVDQFDGIEASYETNEPGTKWHFRVSTEALIGAAFGLGLVLSKADAFERLLNDSLPAVAERFVKRLTVAA